MDKSISPSGDRSVRATLAAECRRLAMECVDGAAPRLGAGAEWHLNGAPCCVIGHVKHRAGITMASDLSVRNLLRYRCEGEISTILEANDQASSAEDRRLRVVFPLLAWADALDAKRAEGEEASHG